MWIFLGILTGILALFALLLWVVRLWASFSLGGEELSLRVGFGFVFKRLLPEREREDVGQEKEHKKKEKEKTKEKVSPRPEPDYVGFAREAAGLLPRLFRVFTVKRLTVDWRLKAGDAASTAIAYGSASAAVGYLYGLARTHLIIKRAKVFLAPEFDAEKGSFKTELKVYTTIWRALRFFLLIYPVMRRHNVLFADQEMNDEGDKTT